VKSVDTNSFVNRANRDVTTTAVVVSFQGPDGAREGRTQFERQDKGWILTSFSARL
jgi:hypothetical protein